MPLVAGYTHVAKDPTHRGGAPRLAEYGIPVLGLWQMFRAGMSPLEISQLYEDVPLGAVLSALAYAADHGDEMKALMAEEERDRAEILKNQKLPPKLKAALERA